jgi:hypothetical protein
MPFALFIVGLLGGALTSGLLAWRFRRRSPERWGNLDGQPDPPRSPPRLPTYFWETRYGELSDPGLAILVWCNRIFILLTVIGFVWSYFYDAPPTTTHP